MIETQQAKQALGDIEARHRDIMNLEKSIQVCRVFNKQRCLMKRVGYFFSRKKKQLVWITLSTKNISENLNGNVIMMCFHTDPLGLHYAIVIRTLYFSHFFTSFSIAGLLIFCEPQNSGKSAKFTKTRKILRNSVEILWNRCLYNIFETYFS